jgi:hypothetical protein
VPLVWLKKRKLHTLSSLLRNQLTQKLKMFESFFLCVVPWPNSTFWQGVFSSVTANIERLAEEILERPATFL